MLDQILTILLLAAIALNILGAIIYFSLDFLKRRKDDLDPAVSRAGTLWQRIFPHERPQAVLAKESDFTRLRGILYSYQDGLI